MSRNSPEWYYCFLCHKEIEDGQDFRFVADEHRQAHEACLNEGEGKNK